MSKEYSFNVMPSVSISRSRFARKSQHKTTFNLGQIIPIYCDEVLPGDTRSFDMASLVRMSTPIAPIMDNIYLDIYAFFVPNRIVWDHWKEFMGENNTSAGIPSSSYSIPHVGSGSFTIYSGSYGDYFGLPVGVSLSPTYDPISALPFRGLAKIYNRWFRDENLIAPLAVQTGDSNEVLVGNNSFVYDVTKILYVSKLPDYFTKGLPYAQKSLPVSIPLGTQAPIKAGSSLYSHSFGLGSGVAGLVADHVNVNGLTGNDSMTIDSDSKTSMYADLSQATAATINQLRYAFQLQKLLEKDALYGTRYWEILAAHFGVEAADASLQDPEYLGGTRININIDQVLQTTGSDTSTPANNELGIPGANSVTAHKGSLFTKSFVEHGYIILVACARHDSTYGQGINRMWTRTGRYDFYWPVFANLGAQEIRNREIFAQGSSADNSTFGYQEAWAEYRYKPSICTGKLRPVQIDGL